MCFAKCVVHGTLGQWGFKIMHRMLYCITTQKSHEWSNKQSITIPSHARQTTLNIFVALHGYGFCWPPNTNSDNVNTTTNTTYNDNNNNTNSSSSSSNNKSNSDDGNSNDTNTTTATTTTTTTNNDNDNPHTT